MTTTNTHMTASKLRVRFGEHEFEADSTADVVQEQFRQFLQLVAPDAAIRRASHPSGATPLSYEKVFRTRGRIISLAVTARTEDAPLLILFGQKLIRQQEGVTGGQIMSGLRASRLPIRRADHILKKHAALGAVQMTGSGRSRTYRLTDKGTAQAQQAAEKLILLLPPSS